MRGQSRGLSNEWRLGRILRCQALQNSNREIVTLAVPALLTLAVDPLVSMVDTAFVAALGTVHLGALGVNTAIFFVAFFVANFLAYGTTPLISEALGLEQKEEAQRLSSEAVIVASLLGTLVLFFLIAGRYVWLAWMGADEGALLAEAEIYLVIRAFAAPAVFLITAGNGVFRGYGDTKTPLYITLTLNLINLGLDALLILGLGLGLAGAALATLCAQWFGRFVSSRCCVGRVV